MFSLKEAPVKKILNKPAIFITNNPDEDCGSSLYFVHPFGTIRCSGSNAYERRATVFIRPYLIGYILFERVDLIFDQPTTGMLPFESRCSTFNQMQEKLKKNIGHLGNVITEQLSYDTLIDPNYDPTSWQGKECNGTSWDTSRETMLICLSVLEEHNFEFQNTDCFLEDIGALRYFYLHNPCKAQP